MTGSTPREIRAVSKRRKVGLACVRKLDAAAKALNDYLTACRDCHDGSGDEKSGAADSRKTLVRDLTEYSMFLDSIYKKD